MTPWIVFTALDGCLLDSRTFGSREALTALDALRRGGTPVVLCTMRTAAESLHYQKLLGIEGPFAIEGGGGVYVPRGFIPRLQWDHARRADHDLVPLSVGREILLEGFSSLKEATGNSIRGFHEMPADEVARDTGLDVSVASLALRREFDEPFKLVRREAELPTLLPRMCRELGLHVTRANAYYHLHGNTDTGLAVEILKSIFQAKRGAFRSLGIGAGEADVTLLKAVDVAAAVQRPDGTHDPVLVKEVRGIRCIPQPGPAGWTRAVRETLGNGEEAL